MTTPPRSERPAMSGYAVPGDTEGVLPWSWAEERLVSCQNFFLVTANAAGRPHSLPVWAVWMPNRQRWGCGCAPTARKLRNIGENPYVVFTTDDSVEVVSIEGTAAIVAGDAAEPVVDAWATKYEPRMDGVSLDEAKQFMRGNTIIEVTPERGFGIIERPDEFATRATRWIWDEMPQGQRGSSIWKPMSVPHELR